MSLYVYVVAVSDEKADEWEKYITHVQSLGIFSSHRCWESGCTVEGISLEGGLNVGRPMYNAGAAEMERWYGKQVIGENEFTSALIDACKSQTTGYEYGADENWLEWLQEHNGQTVIVCNDNEI